MSTFAFPSLDVLPDEERSVYAFVEATKNALRQYMTRFDTADINYANIVVSPEESRDKEPHKPEEISPDYEIIVSASGSVVNPEDNDYTGELIFRLTMEAFCVKRKIGPYKIGGMVQAQADDLVAMNDCHRILYWAAFFFVGQSYDSDGNESGIEDSGQRSLNFPLTGSIERGVFIDAYGAPVEDLTRSAYKAQWEVEFAYAPAKPSQNDPFRDRLIPGLIDQSFGTNLPEDYEIGEHVTVTVEPSLE